MSWRTRKKIFKMYLLKYKISLFIFGIVWICFIFVLWQYKFTSRDKFTNAKIKLPHILWWTSVPADYESIRYCGVHVCRFSGQRTNLHDVKGVLFYASDLRIEDLPLPRPTNQLWALLHEESPRNVPFIPYDFILRHFNYTSTFSRYSDYPLTTYYLPNLIDLTSPDYIVPVAEKTALRTKSGLAPILFLQSNCDTMSGREDYVRELMEFIQVDSFGQCLRNRDLPQSLTEDYLNNLYSPELSRFLSRYKFILAYENGICKDYITEKFWRPLIVGSVPIYFGSPTIKDWEPTKKSVIHIADFRSPKDLADFIKEIDQNDTEYNSYLDHKYEQLKPITNNRLKQALETREYSITNTDLFGAFECFVCRQLYVESSVQTKTANRSHYDCPMPPVYPPMYSNVSTHNDWLSLMEVGKCQAQILDAFLQRNVNYTKQEFDATLSEQVNSNKCQ